MIYLFLATGFEDIEAIAPVDILRRAGQRVETVSITGERVVTTAHGVGVVADRLIEDINFDDAELLILPGGMPGASNLDACEALRQGILRHHAAGRPLAAICAAPSIFAQLGLLNGKKASVHPSFETKMTGCVVTHKSVTVDGNLTTGQALGAAIPFALELARQLEGEEAAARVAKAICRQ